MAVSKAEQIDTNSGKALPTISWVWKLLGYQDPGVHFHTMVSANPDRSNKKVTHISAGRSHLLAIAEDGRALCAAVDGSANDVGQLGGGQKLLEGISSRNVTSDGNNRKAIQDNDLEFDITLKEIPALRKLHVQQLVAGDRHSLALTTEGRVLGWGNNSFGCVDFCLLFDLCTKVSFTCLLDNWHLALLSPFQPFLRPPNVHLPLLTLNLLGSNANLFTQEETLHIF